MEIAEGCAGCNELLTHRFEGDIQIKSAFVAKSTFTRRIMTKDLSFTDLINACYHSILRRAPENETAVEQRAAHFSSAKEIVASFIESEEYQNSLPAHQIHDYLKGNQDYDTLNVELNVEPELLHQMFARIQSEWEALGETEPHWSVITSDQFKPEVIRENMDVFLESGRTNVWWMQNVARRNGIELGKHQTCFELGCGVGRLTIPLAEIFGHVTGYDISPGNLRECDAVVAARGADNITTQLMTQVEDIRKAPDIDVLFTIIVLQHNPPPVQLYLLDVLLGKVRPGGLAYFQLPTFIPDYAFSAEEYLQDSAKEMEMHAVPMRDVFKVLRKHGFEVLEVIQDQFTGMRGSHTFFAKKPDVDTHARRPGLWKRLTG